MNAHPQEHTHINMHAQMKLAHTEIFSVFYKLSLNIEGPKSLFSLINKVCSIISVIFMIFS